MNKLTQIGGLIMIANKIINHITPPTSFYSAVYFIGECTWQLLMIVGISAYGISKADKIFFHALIPFVVCEMVYSCLYWLGFIKYHATLEGFTIINFELFVVFAYFMIFNFFEMRSNWKKLTGSILTLILLEILIYLGTNRA